MLFVVCCEHGQRVSKRRNSNNEGCNGGGAHPRVCTLLGLPVSLSAAAELGGGCSLYATARLPLRVANCWLSERATELRGVHSFPRASAPFGCCTPVPLSSSERQSWGTVKH